MGTSGMVEWQRRWCIRSLPLVSLSLILFFSLFIPFNSSFRRVYVFNQLPDDHIVYLIFVAVSRKQPRRVSSSNAPYADLKKKIVKKRERISERKRSGCNYKRIKIGHEKITVTYLGVLHFPMRIRFGLFFNALSLSLYIF